MPETLKKMTLTVLGFLMIMCVSAPIIDGVMKSNRAQSDILLGNEGLSGASAQTSRLSCSVEGKLDSQRNILPISSSDSLSSVSDIVLVCNYKK